MTHQAPLTPAATPADPAASPTPANGPRWTAAKMADFLRELAATHSVSAAAQSVGMSRQSAYRLRSRERGRPFDLAWDEAFHQSYVNLPYAALDRALNGIEVPHYYKGELIGTSRRYDERLTVALLRMAGVGDMLAVGGDTARATRDGRRFAKLLGRVEGQGPGREETTREKAQPRVSAARSAKLSPTAKPRKAAQSRGSRASGKG